MNSQSQFELYQLLQSISGSSITNFGGLTEMFIYRKELAKQMLVTTDEIEVKQLTHAFNFVQSEIKKRLFLQ